MTWIPSERRGAPWCELKEEERVSVARFHPNMPYEWLRVTRWRLETRCSLCIDGKTTFASGDPAGSRCVPCGGTGKYVPVEHQRDG